MLSASLNKTFLSLLFYTNHGFSSETEIINDVGFEIKASFLTLLVTNPWTQDGKATGLGFYEATRT